MCFLFQTVLFAGASAVAGLVVLAFHAPLWAGAIGGILFLMAAWRVYLIYQATHPDFWAPWDIGLPQEMRMGNAFFPVYITFLLALILIPVFQQARYKAQHSAHHRLRRD